MKVYSWKTLIVTLIICGAALIDNIKNLIAGDLLSIASIAFWVYLLLKGIWVSLTEDGFEYDNINKDITDKVLNKLFDRWSFIVPWVGIVLIVLSLISIKIVPSLKWIAITFFVLGITYHLLVWRLVNKHIKLEKRNRFL